MRSHLEDSVSLFNPFLPKFSASDQKTLKILSALQSYQGPQLLNVVQGVLTFWLESQPAASYYTQLVRFPSIFGKNLSLKDVLQQQLGISEKQPQNPYKKVIYLGAFLNHLLTLPAEAPLIAELTRMLEHCLLQLKEPIIGILKARPRISALHNQLVHLKQELQSEKLAKEPALLLALILKNEPLEKAQQTELLYDLLFGAAVYLLASLDPKKFSQHHAACLSMLNVNSVEEISRREKLFSLAALYYALAKDGQSPQLIWLKEEILEQMNVLHREQYSCGSLKKIVNFTSDNLNAIFSYYLNLTALRRVKEAQSLVGAIWHQAQRPIHLLSSVLSFFPQSKVDKKTEDWQNEFIFTLAALPDNLFSPAKKSRLHNAFEVLPLSLLQRVEVPVEVNERSIFSLA